jgi:hypothetical protein
MNFASPRLCARLGRSGFLSPSRAHWPRIATIVLQFAFFASAQDSQFLFDPNGNLFVQTAAASTPPQVIGQPQIRIVAPGEATSFFVVAADTRALTYQWRFNGTNIGGTTNDALLLQNVSTNNEGSYAVVLTNPSGSVTSAPALLMIDSDADGLPDSWELAFFGNLTNNATADFDGDSISNLQEFRDGTNPTNSASAQFRLAVYTDGGGMVDLSPTQLSYTNGQTVTLTAGPFAPNVFHAWTGDVVTRSNSITLTMSTNHTVRASFLPMDLVWTNVSSGDWDAAANWSPNLVPDGIDNVIIASGGPVTLNTNRGCVGFTLGSSVAGPTLTGSGTLTISGASTWVNGSMGGSGHTVIEAGGVLSVVNPSGIGALLNTRTLENGGTILWTGTGNMALNSGAVITNRPGALFHIQNAAAIGAAVGSGRIDNAGTFLKSANAGTTTIGSSVSFNNSGAVDIQTGTLSLGSGGTHSGTFTVPANTALILAGGAHTAGAGSSITGAGQFTVSGGTANLEGLVNVTGNYTFSGTGTANFTGHTICTNNTVTFSNGGTANFSGTGPVSPAYVNLNNGTLGGTSTVTVNIAMDWSSGSLNDGRLIIAPGATLNIVNPSGLGALLNSRTLENGGTVLWTGTGNMALNSGAVITNRPGALFHVQNAAAIGAAVGSGRIDNAGTFRKSGNTGTTTVNNAVAFNNSGTVDIRSGILTANGGYFSSASALLNCSLGGTTPGAGYGQLQVGGTVTLNGGIRVDLINGFVPSTNNTFTVLTAGMRSSTFASFSYPSNAVTMQLSISANSVIARVTGVSAVPQPAPPPAGLISWWRAEGNALDSVGTNHGVLTNGVTFATGQVGQTFTFDGTDDFVEVPDSTSLRPASVTIEAWVKFFATNGIRIVLVKPLGIGTFDSYGLALQDGAVIASVADNSGFGPFLTGPANTVPGLWYHLAFTFDDATKQQVLYVNGAPVASGTATKTMSYDTHPVLLGADVENGVLSFFHSGQIDEASLYNRSLTIDEIATIYNAGAAGKQFFSAIPPPLLLTPELVGPNVNLTWTAVSNASYRLEFNPSLANLSNWNPVPGDVTATSNTVSKLDPLTPSNRLYRVRVLP